jgi:5-oxoprolinase (ATP-hydrolysing)
VQCAYDEYGERYWDTTCERREKLTIVQRITDPEILERRYRMFNVSESSNPNIPPAVILRQFGYRPNSGGKGHYTGGNGVIREMEFLQPIEVSMLSERRVHAPYGAEGGEPGSTGLNIQVKRTQDSEGTAKERRINIGGKATVKFGTGDRLVIHTPGGGGWGEPGRKREEIEVAKERVKWEARGSLAERAAAQAAFGA